MVWFVIIWIANGLVSIWNAWSVGKAWVESRVAGGWPRVMCWAGAVMAAAGFSWCLLIILVLAGNRLFPRYVPDGSVELAMQIGFVVLAPSIVLSGLAIMLESWRRAFRSGGIVNYGFAAYNTWAQLHNTFAVVNGIGPAFKSIGEGMGNLFSGSRDSDDDNPAPLLLAIIILCIVAAALLGGIFLTVAIIRRAAASDPMPSWSRLQAQHARMAAAG